MIKEAVGSGPYKFVKEEWQPGNRSSTCAIPTTSLEKRRPAAPPAVTRVR